MKIKTDHKWHNFRYRDDVPADVLASQFDWLDSEEINGFIQYKEYWYHISQFERLPVGSVNLLGWDGYHGDSYSSGILICLDSDGEQYQIATYIG